MNVEKILNRPGILLDREGLVDIVLKHILQKNRDENIIENLASLKNLPKYYKEMKKSEEVKNSRKKSYENFKSLE